MIPETHRPKILSPSRAFARIKRGESIFISSGCAEPHYITSQLLSFFATAFDNELVQFFSFGPIESMAALSNDRFRANFFFFGDSSCEHIAKGLADYTPTLLSEAPRMIREKKFKIDVAIVHVSPPDNDGFCSLGVSVELAKEAIEASRYTIAQINSMMPRTYGDSLIHIDKFDAIIPIDEPLIEWQPPPPDNVAITIGQNVAKLIEDGSTIQTGIGKIHDGVLLALSDKKDIGIHTESFTENIINAIKNGVINNKKKSIHEGKVVATLCIGTRKLFDFVKENPFFEFYSCEHVNDPITISQNSKMVSICNAVQVDLTGQAGANLISRDFSAGVGCLPEFVRGAKRSEGGKSIIALSSTSKNGEVSKITLNLSSGAGVFATRGDVQFVVTEYGIANLEGKSIRERALALIEIAHPKFRKQLLEQAKKSNYIFDDQTIPLSFDEELLKKWETKDLLKDGKIIGIRPVRPSDERAIQRFKYSLSDEDVFLRFMSTGIRFNHSRVMPLTMVDFKTHVAIIAFIGSPGEEEIIGIARYYNNPSTNIAEVAFTVNEKWRRRGVGTSLLKHLTRIAKSQNIKGFRAEILAKNKAMMRLFHKSECTIHSSFEDNLFTMWYLFDT